MDTSAPGCKVTKTAAGVILLAKPYSPAMVDCASCNANAITAVQVGWAVRDVSPARSPESLQRTSSSLLCEDLDIVRVGVGVAARRIQIEDREGRRGCGKGVAAIGAWGRPGWETCRRRRHLVTLHNHAICCGEGGGVVRSPRRSHFLPAISGDHDGCRNRQLRTVRASVVSLLRQDVGAVNDGAAGSCGKCARYASRSDGGRNVGDRVACATGRDIGAARAGCPGRCVAARTQTMRSDPCHANAPEGMQPTALKAIHGWTVPQQSSSVVGPEPRARRPNAPNPPRGDSIGTSYSGSHGMRPKHGVRSCRLPRV
jgi:hypothetical protein